MKLDKDLCGTFVMNSTLGSVVPLAMFISEAVKETRMQFIQIHFSPATFDELELDVRVTIGQILTILKLQLN